MNKGNKIQNSRDVGEKGVFQFFSCSRLTKTTDGNHFVQTKLKKKKGKGENTKLIVAQAKFVRTVFKNVRTVLNKRPHFFEKRKMTIHFCQQKTEKKIKENGKQQKLLVAETKMTILFVRTLKGHCRQYICTNSFSDLCKFDFKLRLPD